MSTPNDLPFPTVYFFLAYLSVLVIIGAVQFRKFDSSTPFKDKLLDGVAFPGLIGVMAFVPALFCLAVTAFMVPIQSSAITHVDTEIPMFASGDRSYCLIQSGKERYDGFTQRKDLDGTVYLDSQTYYGKVIEEPRTNCVHRETFGRTTAYAPGWQWFAFVVIPWSWHVKDEFLVPPGAVLHFTK